MMHSDTALDLFFGVILLKFSNNIMQLCSIQHSFTTRKKTLEDSITVWSFFSSGTSSLVKNLRTLSPSTTAAVSPQQSLLTPSHTLKTSWTFTNDVFIKMAAKPVQFQSYWLSSLHRDRHLLHESLISSTSWCISSFFDPSRTKNSIRTFSTAFAVLLSLLSSSTCNSSNFNIKQLQYRLFNFTWLLTLQLYCMWNYQNYY